MEELQGGIFFPPPPFFFFLQVASHILLPANKPKAECMANNWLMAKEVVFTLAATLIRNVGFLQAGALFKERSKQSCSDFRVQLDR